MGEKSLGELTDGLVDYIRTRKEAGAKSAAQKRDEEARRRADQAAIREGMRATSSFGRPSLDEGSGLISEGQGTRADSHSPEGDRRITLKRPRHLRP